MVEHLTCNHEVFGSIPKDGWAEIGGEKTGVKTGLFEFLRGVSRAVKGGRL